MQRFLEILLSNAVLAAVPALLALLLSRLWRRPALTHALWLLALLKLITPPLFTVPVKVLPPAPLIDMTVVITEAPHVNAGLPIDATDPAPVPPQSSSWSISWPTILLAAWAAGSAAMLVLTLARLRRFNALLALASPAPRPILAHANQVAAHLGLSGCPRILLLPGALSPMLWAIGSRACLLLPIDLWRRLTSDQRSSLLAHELAHYKRRDHWVRCLELIAAILYWWHPLVWLARRELREAEEQCCDAWVVHALPHHARAYATALLDTVDFISQTDTPLPMAASGIGNITDLKRRLVMIMKAAHPRRLSSAGRIAVLALGLLVLPALPRLVADEPRAAERAPGVKEYRGMLSKTEQGTLVLSIGEAGTEVKIPTDDDTKVFIDGAAAKLADLKPEMFLTIRQAEGITTRVDARSPRGAARFGGEGEVRRDGDRPREGEVRRDGDRPREGEVRRDGDRPREGEVRRDGEGARREGVARDGERPREGAMRDGEVRRDAPRDGEVRREGPRDGEGVRHEGAPRDGEIRRDAPRDGEGARREGPRDGEGARRDGPRDGEGVRRDVPRDGEGARREGAPRDGEIRREGSRDGERPREGAPRDGEGARRDVPREGEGARRDVPREGPDATRREALRDAERARAAELEQRARAERTRADWQRERGAEMEERARAERARGEAERARNGERPRPDGGARSNIIRGRIERVLGADAIQLAAGEDGREPLKVVIDDKTRVFVDGKPAKLEDVKPGMTVQAHRFENVTTVIDARTATPRE